MTRRALASSIVFVMLGSGCFSGKTEPAASGPRLTPRVARQLDGRLREKVDETGIPGASAAIVFPDGREWSGAAGSAVVKPEQPMTPRTSLPFESVTKVATAALALRLAEQDELRLDDPIGKWYGCGSSGGTSLVRRPRG